MKLYSSRAGSLYHVETDYYCYVPTSLNNVSLTFDEEFISLLSEANKLIGKLDGISYNLIDKDILLSKYVEKEAVVSSQIEGTQASLTDVLQLNKKDNKRKETEEIVNYIHALNYGISLLDKLPISIRYMKEIHKELLKNVRGSNKNPGELRSSQNWIGPLGCNLFNATYIPPSIDKMKECLYDLENYINSDNNIEPLIKIALIHYQFETIHPFLDGNGRLGRLLIPLYLKETKFLNDPLIYISLYFKENRNEYYSLLNDVRFKGKYEEWVKFFLKGIIAMSSSSIETIKNISELSFEINYKISLIKYKNKELLNNVIKYLFKHPYFDTKDLVLEFNISKPTASTIIKKLIENDIISPTSLKERYVTYKFNKYVEILEKGTEI